MPQGRQQGIVGKACGMAYQMAAGPIANQDSSNSDERMSSEGNSEYNVGVGSHTSDENASSFIPPNVDSGVLESEGDSLQLSSTSRVGCGALAHHNPCSRNTSTTNSVQNANDVTKSSAPRCRSVPPPVAAKGVHSDMYNTMFALHSLGNGNVNDYRNRVRALWDGHIQHQVAGPQTNKQTVGKLGKHRRCVSQGQNPILLSPSLPFCSINQFAASV